MLYSAWLGAVLLRESWAMVKPSVCEGRYNTNSLDRRLCKSLIFYKKIDFRFSPWIFVGIIATILNLGRLKIGPRERMP